MSLALLRHVPALLDLLPEAVLHEAIQATEFQKDLVVTSQHPANFIGTFRWAARTAHLRRLADPEAWQYYSSQGQEGIQHRDGLYVVVTVSGTASTGRKELGPLRTRRRGPSTLRRVKCNEAQLDTNVDLFGGGAIKEPEPLLVLWVVYCEGDKVYSELAVPDGMKTEGLDTVFECVERVPLGVVDLADIPVADEDGGGEGDLDIPIAER